MENEIVNGDCISIQFINAHGKWEPAVGLQDLLTEETKSRMRHTSFRFVFFGQLVDLKLSLQTDSPVKTPHFSKP